jgi:hypothetical protein
MSRQYSGLKWDFCIPIIYRYDAQDIAGRRMRGFDGGSRLGGGGWVGDLPSPREDLEIISLSLSSDFKKKGMHDSLRQLQPALGG